MPVINRKFPGKSAEQIYQAVEQVMERMTAKMGLKHEARPHDRAGKVSRMGITGSYLAKDGEVTIDLHFPMLIPGSMKRQVTETIEQKLDKLFA